MRFLVEAFGALIFIGAAISESVPAAILGVLIIVSPVLVEILEEVFDE